MINLPNMSEYNMEITILRGNFCCDSTNYFNFCCLFETHEGFPTDRDCSIKIHQQETCLLSTVLLPFIFFTLFGEIWFLRKGFSSSDKIGKLIFILQRNKSIQILLTLIINHLSSIRTLPSLVWLFLFKPQLPSSENAETRK